MSADALFSGPPTRADILGMVNDVIEFDRTRGWSFYAVGDPAPQGSKSFKGIHGGHAVMAESSKRVAPWRQTVVAAAFGAGLSLDGPVAVRMVFSVRRPKSARKDDRHPHAQPDVSKLARSTEDAITDAGLWTSDARVTGYTRLWKAYAGHPEWDVDCLPVPGVVVAAAPAGDGVEGLLREMVTRRATEAWRRSHGA